MGKGFLEMGFDCYMKKMKMSNNKERSFVVVVMLEHDYDDDVVDWVALL